MIQGQRNKNASKLSGINHTNRILDEFLGSNSNNLQTLINILQNNRDFEVKLIKDANGDLYIWRLTYDESTGNWVVDYINASGNVVVPVMPVEFIDVETILNLINQNLLPIQGTDTPDIDFIGGNAAYVLPSGVKAYTLTVKTDTVTHNNGTSGNKTIYPGSYSWGCDLDRGFVSVTINASAVVNVEDCFVQYVI